MTMVSTLSAPISRHTFLRLLQSGTLTEIADLWRTIPPATRQAWLLESAAETDPRWRFWTHLRRVTVADHDS